MILSHAYSLVIDLSIGVLAGTHFPHIPIEEEFREYCELVERREQGLLGLLGSVQEHWRPP